VLVAVGALLAATMGCAEGPRDAPSPALDERLQLQVGEAASADRQALRIGFLSVTADSRCAKGEVCVWEGDATVRLWLQRAGGAREERELHTSSRAAHAAQYEDWWVRLVLLEPYPIAGRAIAPADYVATLQVTHGAAASDGAVQ
jgi:hypothetical protein